MPASENYYYNLKMFQDARNKAGIAYQTKIESIKKQMDGYEDSDYYRDQIKKAETEREKTIQNAKERFWPKLYDCIQAMGRANRSRKMKPPAAENIALLDALKQRSYASREAQEEDIQRAANNMVNDPLALDLLRQYAAEKRVILRTPEGADTKEYTIRQVDEILSNLLKTTTDFVQSPYTQSSRRVRDYRRDHYGDDSPLQERPVFGSKTDALSEMTGIRDESLAAFLAAVDGEEGTQEERDEDPYERILAQLEALSEAVRA